MTNLKWVGYEAFLYIGDVRVSRKRSAALSTSVWFEKKIRLLEEKIAKNREYLIDSVNSLAGHAWANIIHLFMPKIESSENWGSY